MSPSDRERIYELLLETRARRLKRVPTEENPRETEEESNLDQPGALDPRDENLQFQLLVNDLSEELDLPAARLETALSRALSARRPYNEFSRSIGL